MASPYNGPEPMNFEEITTQENSTKEEEPKVNIPKEIPTELFELFSKVVESPGNETALWEFTKKYLTYLESKSQLVKPFFGESDNLMTAIKNVSIENVPWGIYNCFLTISNQGSTIAQKDNLDAQDNYYIMYVMLSFGGNDSIIYQFTQLLQNLQTQDETTKKTYEQLDSKFIEAFKKYQPKPKNVGFLNKTFKIAGKELSGKMVIIIIVGLLLFIGIIVSAMVYNRKKVIVTSVPSHVGPLTTSTPKVSRPPSIDSSIYSD